MPVSASRPMPRSPSNGPTTCCWPDGSSPGFCLNRRSRSKGELDWLVLGLGVNLVTYPPNAAYPATALSATGVEIAPDAMLAALARSFLGWYEQWRGGEGFERLREAWLDRAHRLGQRLLVRLPEAELAGTFAGLDADGALLLDTPSGRRRISAGEVFPAEILGDIMLLAINANNTNTVFAVWEGDRLAGAWRSLDRLEADGGRICRMAGSSLEPRGAVAREASREHHRERGARGEFQPYQAVPGLLRLDSAHGRRSGRESGHEVARGPARRSRRRPAHQFRGGP